MTRSRWIAGLCLAAIAAGAAWIIGPQPLGQIEIFPGVSFRSDVLPVTEEGGGRVHVVVTDLRAPGLQLYVTPPDPAALAKGFFYRLRWISEVTRTEQLSVVVNATMFASQSRFWLPLPGDLANSAFGTLVADHVVADVQHSDLLWFDDQLQSHLRPWDASLRARDLAAAKWAIGGQIVLQDGQVASTDGLARRPDSRTMAAIDRQNHLFLAVAEDLAPRRLSEWLAELGATDGILLDGGSSSAMAIGGKPQGGVTAGVVYGGWRPVASYFGIRVTAVRQRQ